MTRACCHEMNLTGIEDEIILIISLLTIWVKSILLEIIITRDGIRIISMARFCHSRICMIIYFVPEFQDRLNPAVFPKKNLHGRFGINISRV